MSDKFLNTGGGSSNISNGTATIYAATLGAVSLTASMPIKTNSTKQLVSEKLDINDINNLQSTLNNMLTNPFNRNLQINDLITDETFSLNDDLEKIRNITSATETTTTMAGSLVVPNIKSATGYCQIDINDTDIQVASINGDIQLVANDINLNATNVTINGNPIGGNNPIATPETLLIAQTIIMLLADNMTSATLAEEPVLEDNVIYTPSEHIQLGSDADAGGIKYT